MADNTEALIAAFPRGPAGEVRVSLGEYKGRRRLDVRTYFAAADNGERRPTQRGVTFPLDELPRLRDALQRAVALVSSARTTVHTAERGQEPKAAICTRPCETPPWEECRTCPQRLGVAA